MSIRRVCIQRTKDLHRYELTQWQLLRCCDSHNLLAWSFSSQLWLGKDPVAPNKEVICVQSSAVALMSGGDWECEVRQRCVWCACGCLDIGSVVSGMWVLWVWEEVALRWNLKLQAQVVARWMHILGFLFMDMSVETSVEVRVRQRLLTGDVIKCHYHRYISLTCSKPALWFDCLDACWWTHRNCLQVCWCRLSVLWTSLWLLIPVMRIRTICLGLDSSRKLMKLKRKLRTQWSCTVAAGSSCNQCLPTCILDGTGICSPK